MKSLCISTILITFFYFFANCQEKLPVKRDPYQWPFSRTSIWNMPIHKDAKYVAAKIKTPGLGITVDEDYIILAPDTPITDIYLNNAAWERTKDRCIIEGSILFSAPIPGDFTISKANWLGIVPNSGLAVLMPDGRTIKQTQPFARCTKDEEGTSKYVFSDEDIYGYYGAHGGSRLSAIGGTIRLGELVPGGVIRHALKVNVYCHSNVAYNRDGTPGYRWPAATSDGNAGDCLNDPNGCYQGRNPAVEMGALLAIPSKIKINSLGLETEAARILATAFQCYGAYMVDDTYWDVVAIETEYGPKGRVIDEFRENWGFDFESNKDTPWVRDVKKIFDNLHVVDNNSASTIGGGPTKDFKNRLAPMAPELIPPSNEKIWSNMASTVISYKEKWDTLRVLKNPYKGWYHHLLDNGINVYAIKNDSVFATFPGMDHLYLRLAWSFLEPEEGKYDWHYIDEVISRYVPKGYCISFRISCKETEAYPDAVGQLIDNVQYATPYWVVKAGAKGVVAANEGVKSWVPDWGDPVYLEKLDNFHRAFAERYDGKPWVRYVDIGSIGEWGECHTHFSTRVPPTVAEVKANMNVYIKNYKKSQLVCCDDLLFYGKSDSDVKTLYDFAIASGISLRDNSPLVDWYLDNFLTTWSVSHPHFYDPLYLKKPIIFEPQHYSISKTGGYWLGMNGSDKLSKYNYSGAYIMRKAIETMHATYIGYHGYAEEWLADNPNLTNELANLCGYWYFPMKVVFPNKLTRGENIFSITWLNKGVAPAYNNFGLAIKLEAEKPENSVTIFLENSGNKKWLLNSAVEENYSLKPPPMIKKGEYLLKFKLVEKTTENTRDIQIGIKEDYIDSHNYIEAGKISVLNY